MLDNCIFHGHVCKQAVASLRWEGLYIFGNNCLKHSWQHYAVSSLFNENGDTHSLI